MNDREFPSGLPRGCWGILMCTSYNTYISLSLAIPQSQPLALWKASAFSSTAHCLRSTSLDKPPNPATTCSVELVLSGSIFLSRLQWNWPPHSLYHASSTAIPPFLVCLLPLVNSLRHIENYAARFILKNKKQHQKHIQLTTSLLCLNLFTGSQSHKAFSTKWTLSAINISRALLHLSSVTVSNFTHPPVLSVLLLILSASSLHTLHYWFLRLFRLRPLYLE